MVPRWYAGFGKFRVRTGFLRPVRYLGESMSLHRFWYASMYDHNFLPSLVASLFSWRSLAPSTSSFLHAAINLRPPSVNVSTHIYLHLSIYLPFYLSIYLSISASNAVASQLPAIPNARMSLCTQSVHFFSFPPRPLRTAVHPRGFPTWFTLATAHRSSFGWAPPPTKVISCTTSSHCSHTQLSQAWWVL